MAGNQSNTLLVEVYFEGKDKKRITQTFEFKLIENENEPMIAVRPAPRTYRNISPEDIDMRLVIDEEYNPVSAQVFDRPEKQSKDQLEYVKSSKPNIDSQKSNYSVKTYPESLANKSKESVKKHPYPESSMNTSDESVKQQHKELQLTSESREIAQPILQLIPMYQKPGKLNKNQNVAAGSTVTSSHAGASSASTATKAQYGKTGEKPIEAFYTASQGKGDNLKKTQSLGPRNQEVPGKERYKLPKGYRTPRDYQAKPYTYTAPPSTESREGEKLISRTATQPEAIRINERNCAEMYILNPESEDNLVRTVSVDTPRSKQDRKARVAALNQASEDSERSNTEKSKEERNPRVTIVSPPSENPTSDANATKNVEKSILTSSQDKKFKIHVIMKNSHGQTKEVVTTFSKSSLPNEIVAEITDEPCPKHEAKKRKVDKPRSAVSEKQLHEVFKNDEIKAVSQPNITNGGSKAAEAQEANKNNIPEDWMSKCSDLFKKKFLERSKSSKENKDNTDSKPKEKLPKEDLANDDIIFKFPIYSDKMDENPIHTGAEKPKTKEEDHCLCQHILKKIGEAIATCSHIQELKSQEVPQAKEPRKKIPTDDESSSDEMIELSNIPERKRKARPKLLQNNRIYKLQKSPEGVSKNDNRTLYKQPSREETSNSDYIENFKEKPIVVIPTVRAKDDKVFKKPETKKMAVYDPKDFTAQTKNPLDFDYPSANNSDESFIENVYREKPQKKHVCSCARARVDSQVLEDQLISILQKIGLIYAEKSRDERTQKEKKRPNQDEVEPLRGYSNKRQSENLEPLGFGNKIKDDSPEKIEKLRVSESFIKALKNQGSFKWSKSKRKPEEYTISCSGNENIEQMPSIIWTPNDVNHSDIKIKPQNYTDTPSERIINKWAAKRKLFHEPKDSDDEFCVISKKPEASREPKQTRVCKTSPYRKEIDSSSSEEEYILLKVKKKKLTDKNKATSTPKLQDVSKAEKPVEKMQTASSEAVKPQDLQEMEKKCWQKIEEQEKELQKLKEECKKMAREQTKASPPVEKTVSFPDQDKIEKTPEKKKSQVTKIPEEERDKTKAGSADKILPMENQQNEKDAGSPNSSLQVGGEDTFKYPNTRRQAKKIKA